MLQMSYVTQLAVKQEDALCLELYVKEACMPQMVLAIATAANHKELLRTNDGTSVTCNIQANSLLLNSTCGKPIENF